MTAIEHRAIERRHLQKDDWQLIDMPFQCAVGVINPLSHTSYGRLPTAAIIGLGYIGLPTAAVAARAGLKVLGFDISSAVVETISAGKVHIKEEGLEALVQEVVAAGNLTASTTLASADVYVITVPTPLRDGNRPDVDHVLSAARSIAPVMMPGNIVILESTSPIGTTEAVRDVISQLRPDLCPPSKDNQVSDWHMAYCPERVIPGRTLIELVANDRSIGGITGRCAEVARDFYLHFVEGECSLTGARTAEMVKLVENSYRDVNIAFANELSLLADRFHVDVWEVIRLANHHPRVNILKPGPGVGGHCIAVDPWFLVSADPKNARLIRTAREVNDDKTDYVIARALALSATRPAANVACFGLAFKPDIDDFRESPALKVASALAESLGERLTIVEPHARELPVGIARFGVKLKSADEAFALSDVLIMLVDHREFKTFPQEAFEGKVIYDTKGIW
jgi:UDP-N-acetyl-D-mannosaminuronic acid dehydrogenase